MHGVVRAPEALHLVPHKSYKAVLDSIKWGAHGGQLRLDCGEAITGFQATKVSDTTNAQDHVGARDCTKSFGQEPQPVRQNCD